MLKAPKIVRKKGGIRYHRLAKRTGGIPRDEAIQRANVFIESVKSKYHEWVFDDILRLEEAVVALRGRSTPNPEDIENAYHRARVIRDLGTTMGYPLVTAVTDSLCELLHRFKNANVCDEVSVEAHFCALLLVISPGYAVGNRGGIEDLLFDLRRAVDRFPSTADAAVEPTAH